ncbi:peptidase C1B, bleomycin hydrolase [Lentithecium fluviatile CBS 122367]|uniref:Cysteine proteinase 1, mitochondrial n=1 Tax=Lentithecium fluviatile CBS 122367 TaxID=1168545 RepID=A0A6G1JHW8_9PLEO|nr:peptidase C1B, bleomycin hydrolase [Lentithecium fluviatile CBS 122367]
MGSNQSRPSDADIQEQLLERLHALHIKDDKGMNEKDGYVYIDNEARRAQTPVVAHKQHVSTVAIGEWEKELMQDPKNRLALAALSSNAANAVLSSRSAAIADTQNFNIKIPLEGSPITNQASSGRCWIFASTNDKLEKANYFLESVLDTVGEDIDSRLMQTLLAAPVNDGGQWDMVVNLVQKYGLVPQSLYPDSFNAANSSTMDRLITTKLREDAIRLRSLAKMLREIHLILTLMLGPPPAPDKPFTWEFYDRENALQTVTICPKAFAKELSDSRTVRALGGTDVHRLFSLVNDPRNAYNRLLSVKRLGNVYEGRPVTYVNVDMTTMKTACIEMLKKGFPVFFGSDVGKFSDSTKGVMDTNLFEYELGFNIKLGLKKSERLQTGESQMTHAMVLTAVHVVDGKPVRWRVENPWSDRVGDNGYFVMSDAWMDEFVYQAVVDPAVVSATVRKVLEQKPKMLELWDPMGALA